MPSPTPRHILIADDESLVLDIITAELESLGCVIVGRASDGLAAVELTVRHRPDVVVLDIAMPEMDGLAAAARIQAECPTPVVILSAHDDQVEILHAAEAGVGAYLVKPPRASELERAMAIAMARHADLMELRRVNAELKQAVSEVRTLGALLPICCSCKKIRDDKGYWQKIEAYISARSPTRFTHSYCPDCARSYFPDLPTTP